MKKSGRVYRVVTASLISSVFSGERNAVSFLGPDEKIDESAIAHQEAKNIV